jgi:hypothetical protein
MKNTKHASDSYAARYPDTAQFFEESFGPIQNVEDLMTDIQELIKRYESGTREQRAKRTVLANEYGVLQTAVRAWFAEIQQRAASLSTAYQSFARDIVARGDCVITFNYDVLLERELRLAGKFEIGDGYGFQIETLPAKSATKVLKLHGSTSWLALLFGGRTSGFFQVGSGGTLESRPVIAKNELSYLGYADAIDPRFAGGGAALPVMIFPARSKEFYFASNTGVEYVEFWDDLWRQADAALRSAERIVMCGYSLNAIDKRAFDLLLNAPKKGCDVIVASGGDTKEVVEKYRKAGYAGAVAADEVLFQQWVMRTSSDVATVR